MPNSAMSALAERTAELQAVLDAVEDGTRGVPPSAVAAAEHAVVLAEIQAETAVRAAWRAIADEAEQEMLTALIGVGGQLWRAMNASGQTTSWHAMIRRIAEQAESAFPDTVPAALPTSVPLTELISPARRTDIRHAPEAGS